MPGGRRRQTPASHPGAARAGSSGKENVENSEGSSSTRPAAASAGAAAAGAPDEFRPPHATGGGGGEKQGRQQQPPQRQSARGRRHASQQGQQGQPPRASFPSPVGSGRRGGGGDNRGTEQGQQEKQASAAAADVFRPPHSGTRRGAAAAAAAVASSSGADAGRQQQQQQRGPGSSSAGGGDAADYSSSRTRPYDGMIAESGTPSNAPHTRSASSRSDRGRDPSQGGRGPGGHQPPPQQSQQRSHPGDTSSSSTISPIEPTPLGSIAAEIEHEASSSSGGGRGSGGRDGAASASGTADVEDLLKLDLAPSFGARPPTPSPPRKSSDVAAAAAASSSSSSYQAKHPPSQEYRRDQGGAADQPRRSSPTRHYRQEQQQHPQHPQHGTQAGYSYGASPYDSASYGYPMDPGGGMGAPPPRGSPPPPHPGSAYAMGGGVGAASPYHHPHQQPPHYYAYPPVQQQPHPGYGDHSSPYPQHPHPYPQHHGGGYPPMDQWPGSYPDHHGAVGGGDGGGSRAQPHHQHQHEQMEGRKSGGGRVAKSPSPRKRSEGGATYGAEDTKTPPGSRKKRVKSEMHESRSSGSLFAPSPYRSPTRHMSTSRSSKAMQSSPLLPQTPSGAGYYGVLDTTPGGANLDATKLDDFFPLHPSASFGIDPNEPAPFQTAGDEGGPPPAGGSPFGSMPGGGIFGPDEGRDGGGGNRNGGGGSNAGQPVFRSRRGDGEQRDHSPFTNFMGDLSPFSGGTMQMQGSPIQQYRDQRDRNSYPSSSPDSGDRSEGYRSRRMPEPIPPLSSKSSGHRTLKASPVSSAPGTASLSKPTRQLSLYSDGRKYSSPPPGPFRLQLGSVGMRQTETRKGMDGINSALRGSRPSQSPPYGSGGRSYDNRAKSSSSSYRNDYRTPVKRDAPAPSPKSVQPQSTSRTRGFPETPSQSTSGSAARYSKMPTETPTTKMKTPPSTVGKESEPPSAKAQRRNPCNCKKSKCLKLYCECFAAELYCSGCNCTDCSNSEAYEAIRTKAIRDTKAKNPNAFKPRIAVKSSGSGSCNSPSTAHNMGCRCKKSACLKKYCECFEAGVMCSSKCKCIECLNYVGSQALIDRRRKIKDHRGAELAMRSADEAWKGSQQKSASKAPPPGMPPHAVAYPSPAPSRMGHPMVVPSMIHPGASPPPGPHPHYMAPPMMMAPQTMGYSPMGVQPTPPSYAPSQHTSYSDSRRHASKKGRSDPKKKHQEQIQVASTPRSTPRTAPAVRLGFDPLASKKKRKMVPGQEEPTISFGTRYPAQPKTAALAIFSFLSNEDLFHTSLVSKEWNKLSLDDELWQF